jgi:hypothetical protein
MKEKSMDDHEILRMLGEALSPAGLGTDEEPPAHVMEAAFAAGDWVRVDYELAELVADSADNLATAGVRAVPTDLRQLTYSLRDLTIECELGAGALVGQVVPASGLRLDLIRPDGQSRPLEVDAEGRFLLQLPPTGPVGIRCTRPGRQAVLTPWLLA